MNHDEILIKMGSAYKAMILEFIEELDQIKNPKHQVQIRQEFEKARHYYEKFADKMVDVNEWLTAFGVDGNAQNS